MSIFVWATVGFVCAVVATKFVPGMTRAGAVGDGALGVCGALTGGWALLPAGVDLDTITLLATCGAFGGAAAFLAIGRLAAERRTT